MIKLETLGEIDRVVVNPVIVSTDDVENYSFITDNDETYLVTNTITGDAAYKDDNVIKAGEYLNGYLVRSLDGQKLVIDGKHISYASGKTYADLAEDDILAVTSTGGKLEVVDKAPDAGVYFQITDVGVRLTEAAVKAKIFVAQGE